MPDVDYKERNHPHDVFYQGGYQVSFAGSG